VGTDDARATARHGLRQDFIHELHSPVQGFPRLVERTTTVHDNVSASVSRWRTHRQPVGVSMRAASTQRASAAAMVEPHSAASTRSRAQWAMLRRGQRPYRPDEPAERKPILRWYSRRFRRGERPSSRTLPASGAIIPATIRRVP
jgi:hypothetical protein